MTYDEIKQKLKSTKMFSIKEVKQIANGKQIELDNRVFINCYTTGKYNVQGKDKLEVEKFLSEDSIENNGEVFVVYGHDKAARVQLEALLRRWSLEPIILDQKVSGGTTIIEKLEEYSSSAGYAIVLATPDDLGRAKEESNYKFRVRQNVVLELGMFLSKLGRKKVAILLKQAENFDRPSDINGLIYFPFKEEVDEVKVDLAKELVDKGYRIELSHL